MIVQHPSKMTQQCGARTIAEPSESPKTFVSSQTMKSSLRAKIVLYENM